MPSVDDDPEMQKILKELQAAEKTRPVAPNVPNLTKVNVGAVVGAAVGSKNMNPDIAVILDTGVASYGVLMSSKAGSPAADDPLRTGGHDLDHSGFTLQQAEMAIGASVDPYFRFDGNFVFKEGVEVEEAYATALTLPYNLQARAGAFYSHFGRKNLQHPHQWAFISQPLVYGLMLGEDGQHGIGAEVSWLSPLPWSLVLYGSAQDTSGGCCSPSYSPVDVVDVRSPADLVYTGAIEQFFPVTDDLSVMWGLSAQGGPADYYTSGGRAELWGTDLLVRYKPAVSGGKRWLIDFQAEAIARTRHSAFLDTLSGGLDSSMVIDDGLYAELLWYPSWEYAIGGRYDLAQSRLDNDPANPGLGKENHRGTLMFQWSPTHFSRLRAEAELGTRGQGDLLLGVMANLEVNIGAHGAHKL